MFSCLFYQLLIVQRSSRPSCELEQVRQETPKAWRQNGQEDAGGEAMKGSTWKRAGKKEIMRMKGEGLGKWWALRYCWPQVVRIDTKLVARDRVGDSSDGFDFCPTAQTRPSDRNGVRWVRERSCQSADASVVGDYQQPGPTWCPRLRWGWWPSCSLDLTKREQWEYLLGGYFIQGYQNNGMNAQ